MTMLTVALVALLALVLTVVLFRRQGSSAPPPGPRAWPIIGNILDIPRKSPWKVYARWSEDNGSEMLHLKLPGASILFLNSHRTVQDLLVKRSAIYSDRPQSTMLSELMGMSWVFGLMPYGNRWKDHRRIFHREFNIETLRPHEIRSARRLLVRLLDSSVNYSRELQLTTGDAILSATYGISVNSEDDYFIHLAESLVDALVQVSRSPYLVDMFPAIKKIPSWFPGAGFKRQASKWRSLGVDVQTVPFEHVKSEVDMGTAMPSVASKFLASMRNSSVDCSETQMRSILAEAYLGGAGATVGTLCSFTLAMSLFPEIQERAHAAVTAALGQYRLPDFSDYGKIPYLDALVNEVLRWNPGAPLGLFHAVSQDDYYDGYLIRKGTMICPNTWAVLHDASIYGPSPHEFIPERFLLPDGTRNMVIPDPDGAFGFGRRVCPGRVMGRELLWITAASILVTFQIGEPIGSDGKPLDPTLIEYSNSMSSRPPYFDCLFTVRPGAEALIRCGVEELN
ncbi:cytochrome P450 [Dendrothele bispora CBS 962.96]|uniref:Cytochrome P450 n=1 Tax=Dendrothele bispora (strain CBS 962.96) TaxID=1314807 RepID=A0A4S8MVL6_DENBC|nr:cytochrome P450 [Dendrothele bispora CBS 962.96]